MPSDILRDLGKDAPAAVAEAPAPKKPRDVYESMLDMNQTVQDAITTLLGTPQEAKVKEQAAERFAQEQEAVAERAHQQVVRPLISNVLGASQPVSYETVPKALPQPEIPSLKARGYLDVSEKNALSGVIAGLGVMAQLAMAGKAPVAALSALTGAMEGWHTGDAERAQRDWRVYLAQVDKIREENQDNMRMFEAKMQVHGTNLAAAQAALVAGSYEAGHYEQAAHIARQGVVAAHQQLLDIMDAEEKLRDTTAKIMQAQATNAFKEVMLKDAQARIVETARHNRVMESERAAAGARAAEGLKIRKELGTAATKAMNDNYTLDLRDQELGRLEKSIAVLDAKGAIPKTADAMSKGLAWFKIQTSKDPEIAKAINDLDRWGTALLTSKEIATGITGAQLRLKSIAEKETGGIRTIPRAWWDEFLSDTHKQFNARRRMNAQTLSIAGRTAEGVGIELPAEEWGEPQ